jgi:hypothetical protein
LPQFSKNWKPISLPCSEMGRGLSTRSQRPNVLIFTIEKTWTRGQIQFYRPWS